MRVTATSLAAILVLAIAGCAPLDTEEPGTPEASPTVTEEVEANADDAPDVTGLALDEARIELADYDTEEVDASGDDRAVLSPGNWFVIDQSTDGVTVLLTIENERDAAEAERAAQREQAAAEEAAILELSNGVSSQDALWACSDAADELFPFGVRYRHLLGVMGTQYREDDQQWFAKVEATITNEYGADADYETECYVDTSTGEPVVVDFVAY